MTSSTTTRRGSRGHGHATAAAAETNLPDGVTLEDLETGLRASRLAAAAMRPGAASNQAPVGRVMSLDEVFLEERGVPDVRAWAEQLRAERAQLLQALANHGLSLDNLPDDSGPLPLKLLRGTIPNSPLEALKPHWRANSALRKLLSQRQRPPTRPRGAGSAASRSSRRNDKPGAVRKPTTPAEVAAEIKRTLSDRHPPMGRRPRGHLDAILAYMRRPELQETLTRWLNDRLSSERLLSSSTAELDAIRRLLKSQYG